MEGSTSTDRPAAPPTPGGSASASAGLEGICGSPLGEAISALDCFTSEEARSFYAAIDQLPNFDSPTSTTTQDYKYTVDEEDWQWLATAVGTRTQSDLVNFANGEYEKMALDDPDLAELAKLGETAAEELGGDTSLEEQIAACQELTRFADHFDLAAGSGGSSSADTQQQQGDSQGEKPKKERARGTAWSEEEHKLFLEGLEKYGKGDWRSISRNCVLTRTPAQVASHAQKYFIRQEGQVDEAKKKNRRVSIHDINSTEQTMPPRNQRKRKKEERAAERAAKQKAQAALPAAPAPVAAPSAPRPAVPAPMAAALGAVAPSKPSPSGSSASTVQLSSAPNSNLSSPAKPKVEEAAGPGGLAVAAAVAAAQATG